MLYLFFLGRDFELSKLEIESLLENKGINFKIADESKKIVLIDCDKLQQKIIDEFGGVIKIAEVISSSGRIDQIEDNLEKANIYSGNSNKTEYYIDAFNTNLLSFVEDYLKEYFKTIKVKALYKGSKEPSKLINKSILDKGINIIIFKNCIGRVIAITNPGELKRRDLSRPEVDYMKVISIRLAKILINIAQVKKNEVLLDPFSGSGTILQEALLKGINVIGIDSDKESIKQAKANLDWLISEYNIKNNFQLINLDCRKLVSVVKENSVNGVVTEPYMGPYIRKLPTMNEAKKLVVDLSGLYYSLLGNLKKVVKKNGKIVIIIPKFRTIENRTVFIDFKSIAEKNGFSLVFKPIQYGYKESKLLREIYVLEKSE